MHTNRRNVTIAVMVATFLTAMDNTVVSTAMPTIVSDLGGLSLFSWVFAVYMLTTAVTTPIYGKLADIFGRKVIFTFGTIVFLAGSMLSGASHTMTQLIWFRAFQGIGAGAVMPITLTIIGDIYTYEQRAKMQGLFSAIWGIAGIVGPLVGGFFVDVLSWRWIFYINIPVGLLSMVLVWIFLHEQFEKHQRKIDYWGAAVFCAAMTALLYALLSGGSTYAWSSFTIIGLLVAAAVLLAAFIWIETKTDQPILPLDLFRIRVILVSNLSGFLSGCLLMGITVYLPMWIQGIGGHSATSAGLTLTPMSIGWPIGATLGGRLMLKIGSKTVAVIGMAALVIGYVALAFVHLHTAEWVLVVIMVVIGFGFGFSMTSFTVVVQTAVGWNMRGAATASVQFMRTLGQTVGVAVLGSWFNHTLTHQQGDFLKGMHVPSGAINALLNPVVAAKQFPQQVLLALRELLETGLHHVFLLLGIVAVAGFLISVWLPRHAPNAADTPSPASNP